MQGNSNLKALQFRCKNEIAENVVIDPAFTASNSFVSLSTGDVNKQPDLQRTYQVMVAATHDMGIGKDGKLPWREQGLAYLSSMDAAVNSWQ
ncbi:hypothetical protein LOK49_LG01G03343 [Camellia lanceoleosa]|uniref:Uncharacterized protein n=1 Tax=Camellia lanceoleosa TaxID=1840588 RepID=A0ACC0J5K4_9ERIC|nr:hypothetical protein LOK49_LG01G03343 [Camellia lanceoleosa]